MREKERLLLTLAGGHASVRGRASVLSCSHQADGPIPDQKRTRAVSAFLAANRAESDAPPSRDVTRRIAIVRALLALVWAAALVIAVGDQVPSTSSDVPIAA